MHKLTEVFYYNAKKELQKLELYNIKGSMYLEKQQNKSLNILCIIENGMITYTSPEFGIIEDSISDLLTDLTTHAN
jgi:virulence-associated protein VapD